MTDIPKNIGEELIRESQGPKQKKRGISDDLFPYILVASMNGMSARAISRWLEEKQEVKLSAAMVAKVIRESDKRCMRLFEVMRHKEVVFLHSITSLGTDVMADQPATTLFDKPRFESRSPHQLEQALLVVADESGTKKQMFETYDFIMENWFALPEQFKNECQRAVAKQEKEGGNEHANG